MKFYQNELPSMFSGQFVSTEVLQTLVDDLFAKASRPLNDCVIALFENRYHARTGLIGPGNTTTQNTWRNNFNLQKGIGCYAPPQDLASSTFLNEPRVECRYLNPEAPGQLAGATCRLCATVARYRNEDHRKWLRIDPGGAGYAVLDLMNIQNYTPYVAPGNTRIPLVPAIIALYYDALPGLITATRPNVDTADFASDFNLSDEELDAYFDRDPTNQFNSRLIREIPGITYAATGAVTAAAAPTLRIRTGRGRRARAAQPPRQPVLTGTPVAPPAVNTGWECEQYVAAALRNAGWTVYDVSRQHLGYDLLAQQGRETRYVDAKSSLGLCSPSLTSREWQQARAHARHYILAIVENFNPTGEAVVYWVPDPASTCNARAATQVYYSIPRSSWATATVPLNSI
ncbi:MAG: DUF3883 domain-containing protein [Terriglobales bacterium]|jgi:hypothetical protein